MRAKPIMIVAGIILGLFILNNPAGAGQWISETFDSVSVFLKSVF